MRAVSKALTAVAVVGLIFVLVVAYIYVSPQTSAASSTSTTISASLITTTSSAAPSGSDVVNVVIQYGDGYSDGAVSQFNPQVIVVVIGINNTVVWTNEDFSVHNIITTSAPTTGPASGDLAQGQWYSFTFTTPGTYSYYCSYHPWMNGEVIVESQS
jgi:plastocyanin